MSIKIFRSRPDSHVDILISEMEQFGYEYKGKEGSENKWDLTFINIEPDLYKTQVSYAAYSGALQNAYEVGLELVHEVKGEFNCYLAFKRPNVQ